MLQFAMNPLLSAPVAFTPEIHFSARRSDPFSLRRSPTQARFLGSSRGRRFLVRRFVGVKTLPNYTPLRITHSNAFAVLAAPFAPHIAVVVSLAAVVLAAAIKSRRRKPSEIAAQTVTNEAAPATLEHWFAGLVSKLKYSVREYDIPRLLPLMSMYFSILLSFTILRDIKDVLVVTAKYSGAESIPFLRTWIVVPFSFLSMLLYSRLSDHLSSTTLFAVSLIPFLIFFGIFGAFLYPLRDVLHFHGTAMWLHSVLPAGVATPVSIMCSWTYVIFYVATELWGTLILSLGFWSFANDVFTVDEAKRVYPLLGLSGNIPSLFLGGALMKHISEGKGSVISTFDHSLRAMMGIVVACGLVILASQYALARLQQKRLEAASLAMEASLPPPSPPVITAVEGHAPPSPSASPVQRSVPKKKPKLGIIESFWLLARSPYLRNLGILVMCYGVAMTLNETLWKSQIRILHPHPKDFSRYMGEVEMLTAGATVVSTAFSAVLFRTCGWGVSAMVTPIVTAVMGLAFMGMALTQSSWSAAAVSMGWNPLGVVGFLGTLNVAVSHAVKYSMFDPSKEMVYIPLDRESKSKGKAAIDVCGYVVGKSGGAILLQGLIFSLGSFRSATPAICVLFAISTAACVFAVSALEKSVSKKAIADADDNKFRKLVSTPQPSPSSSPTPYIRAWKQQNGAVTYKDAESCVACKGSGLATSVSNRSCPVCGGSGKMN